MNWTKNEEKLVQCLDRVVRSWEDLADPHSTRRMNTREENMAADVKRAREALAEVRRDAGLPEAWGAAPPERGEVVRHLWLVGDDDK